MSQFLPKHLITGATISREVKGQPLDFTITFNIYGEVLGIKNHLLELPEAAQLLMLGNDIEEIKELSQRVLARLKYEVPMVVQGHLKGNKYTSIIQKSKELLEANEKAQSSFFMHLIKDDWTKGFLKLNQQTPKPPTIQLLARLIKEQPEVEQETLKALLEYEEPLSIPVLLNLIPNLTNNQRIKYAYRCLGKVPDSNTFIVLMHRFQDEKQKDFRAEILIGLRPNKCQELRNLVVDYHRNNEDIDNEVQLNLIKVLSDYPDSASTNIMLEYFTGPEEKIAYLAFKKLIKRVGSNQLLKLNKENYKHRKTIKHLHTALFQYTYHFNAAALPSSASLISTLRWACEKNGNEVTFEHIANVLSRKAKFFRNIRPLKKMLESDMPNYKIAALYQYKKIGEIKHLPLILKVVKEKDFKLKKEAISTIKYILKRENYKDANLLYANLLKEEIEIKEDIIWGIITELEKASDPMIFPVLIEEIRGEHTKVKNAVAHALRYFPQAESVAVLKEFEKDKDIGGKVSDSLRWIENPVKAKQKNDELMASFRKLFADANKKYEE